MIEDCLGPSLGDISGVKVHLPVADEPTAKVDRLRQSSLDRSNG